MERSDDAVATEEVNGRLLSSGVSRGEKDWEVDGNLILEKQRLRFFPWMLGIIPPSCYQKQRRKTKCKVPKERERFEKEKEGETPLIYLRR